MDKNKGILKPDTLSKRPAKHLFRRMIFPHREDKTTEGRCE